MLVSLSHDKTRGAVYGFDRFSSAQVYPVSQTWGYTGFLDLKLIKFPGGCSWWSGFIG